MDTQDSTPSPHAVTSAAPAAAKPKGKRKGRKQRKSEPRAPRTSPQKVEEEFELEPERLVKFCGNCITSYALVVQIEKQLKAAKQDALDDEITAYNLNLATKDEITVNGESEGEMEDEFVKKAQAVKAASNPLNANNGTERRKRGRPRKNATPAPSMPKLVSHEKINDEKDVELSILASGPEPPMEDAKSS